MEQPRTQIKLFQKTVQTIECVLNKETLQQLHQQFYIREFKIWEIDSSFALTLYAGIMNRLSKSRKNTYQRNQFGWFQNELRLFVWMLTLYSKARGLKLQLMATTPSHPEWHLICQLFPSKPQILFEYQCRNMLKDHNQHKKWIHEEDVLFETLVKRDNCRLKWSDLGKNLYIESKRRFFRTPKQCRQRWLNHLDPSKLKKYWLEEQDFALVEHVRFYGKKWPAISKQLDNRRNQHSIKNRFKSLITKESKIMPFGQNNTQAQILQHIYHRMSGRGGDFKELPILMEQPDIHQKQHEAHSQLIQQQQVHSELSKQQQLNSQLSNHDNEEQYANRQSQIQYCRQHFFQSKHDHILSDIPLNEMGKISSSQSSKKDSFWNDQARDERHAESSWRMESKTAQSNHSRAVLREQSELQKRIRADMLLQSDPFQILKSYFQKS